jgi:Transposase IS66 family
MILGYCLAHARRHFVEVTPSFPTECRHVLETLREVYRHDADARAQGLGPDERLAFHQAHSGPLMDDLQAWLTTQIDEHRVEPNSGLGHAIAYLRNHWTPLTLFLRQPGAPLDNNGANAASGICVGMPPARLCRVGGSSPPRQEGSRMWIVRRGGIITAPRERRAVDRGRGNDWARGRMASHGRVRVL